MVYFRTNYTKCTNTCVNLCNFKPFHFYPYYGIFSIRGDLFCMILDTASEITSLLFYLLINYMMIKPSAGVETYSEHDTAHSPVGKHSNPYSNRTKAIYTA